MKKVILFICCFFLLNTHFAWSATIHSYADNSILSQGRFIKVQIKESGLYKLSYADLKAKGIAEPSNLRIFGYGGAVLNEDFSETMHDDLPEIAVYDTGDAILFYAQGVNKWTYDASKDMFVHQLNTYSNYGYYFVTSDNAGEKKRIELQPAANTAGSLVNNVTEFTDYWVYEEEIINYGRAGREFYGEKFTHGGAADFSVDFPGLLSGSAMKVRLDVMARSTKTTNSKGEETKNNKSTYSLKLNGFQTKSFEVSGSESYDLATPATVAYAFTADAKEKAVFTLAFANAKEATATGYLNYLEVNAQRKLKMTGSAMSFHNKKNIGSNSYNRYALETDNPAVQIWNISDQLNVKRLPAEATNGKLNFVDAANSVKSYLAVNVTDSKNIPSATLLDVVPNQNLHSIELVDMLIITHPNFLEQAKILAQAHYTYNDGLRVKVVTANEVYNEFSSGTPDATAYRRICKMFYDRTRIASDRLKYLLLIGKGSYDNRGLLADSGDKYLLTFQAEKSLNQTKAYTTDDYFGLLDDDEGKNIGTTDKIDIGIGRFPVRTKDEVKNIVNKSIRYMKNEDRGEWKNQLCFIGDNGDNNSHMRQADSFANMVSRLYPGYCANKILLDAYRQDAILAGRYPDAKRYFLNLVNSGLFMVSYMGHGTVNGWGQTLNLADIRAMKNEHLPLYISGTCELSRYDREYVCASEEFLKNPNGGAIGVFSATRTVYQNYNETIVKHFTDSVFSLPDKTQMAVGDAVRMAKNASSYGVDLGINSLSYVYIGDPAIKLNYPTEYKVIATEINGNSIQGQDTLQAMSVAAIKGIIADKQGGRQADFNGELEITILDKEETRKTLANLKDSKPFEYKERTKVISKGNVKIEDGEFEYVFMLPKDIKYNYGKGRFSFYAKDDEKNYEAQGYCENFIIGGHNENFVEETDGPDAEVYLNDKNFVSGGRVNKTPVFIADLHDLNGINTYGVMPGHDLTLCVDNEYWYQLNDYYETEGGDYKTGSIRYQLPEQIEGKHILTFRAWDLLGNSTMKDLEFEVTGGENAAGVFAVDCYPNPVQSTANIYIVYDQENVADVTLEIFDLSGKKVWSKTQTDLSTISWNVPSLVNGESSSGMYIYRVSVCGKDGSISTKSNKIMVIKQ